MTDLQLCIYIGVFVVAALLFASVPVWLIWKVYFAGRTKRIDLCFVTYTEADKLLQHSTEKWQLCPEYEDKNTTHGWVWLERTK